MSVLDAYAVVAYFRGERAAADVTQLLRAPTWISGVNVAEVMDQLVRIDGNDPDEVEVRLATLCVDGMTVVPATQELGVLAGTLRARHYHKKTCKVSLADCFAAATALQLRLPIATADPDLIGLVRAESGTHHRLPAVQT